MPSWLQAISAYNPLSYVVDAMRAMLLTGDYSGLPLDIFALLLATSVFIGAASIVLKRLIE
jgi:ABC-2 type transport system permease protein